MRSLTHQLTNKLFLIAFLLVVVSQAISTTNRVFSQSPLIDAASTGRIDLVRKYIDEGWDVDVIEWQRTPLTHAHDVQVAEALIKAGCDMKLTANRDTALLMAAESSSPNHVRLLLDSGCNIEARDDNQRTPLILAAQENKAEVVELLCRRGAKLNAQDKYGHTALSWASWTNGPRVVEVLIKAGADINQTDYSGQPPLYFAANRSVEKVRLLLKTGANMKPLKWNPLMRAVVTQDSKGVKSCLPKTDLQSRDLNERTVLHLAAYLGNPEIIKLLVEAGANLESRDKDKRTPLHLASLHDSAENIRALIECGADVNSQDRRGILPLSICRDARAAEALFSGGAKPDEYGKLPFSPLFTSLGYLSLNGRQASRLDMTKTLVKHGADIHQTYDEKFGKKGITTLMYACENSSPETVKFLIEKGVEVKAKDSTGATALHYAARGLSAESIRLLIEKGVDLEAQNEDGASALFEAARFSNLNHLQALIQAGTRVDTVLKNTKRTALFDVTEPQVITYLVKQGIDPNQRDAYGETPIFSHAAYGRYILLEALLQNGCRADVVNDEGFTVLGIAVKNGQVENVQLLLKHAKIGLDEIADMSKLAGAITDKAKRDAIQMMLRQSLSK